jgi:hypothetical protein
MSFDEEIAPRQRGEPMRIAFVGEDNFDPRKANGAVERRRLRALIPCWEEDGCEVFPWRINIACDVIYIVNLPAVLNTAAKVFSSVRRGQAVVVGMIEDFDTARWASMCDELCDDIVSLIKTDNAGKSTFTGRLRSIRDWMAQLGLIQTHRTKVQSYLKSAHAVLSTSELQAAGLRRYNPNVAGVADCIPDDDYKIVDVGYAKNLLEEKADHNFVVMVWEGTQWGLQLLEQIRNPLNSIVEATDFKICLRLIMPRYRSPFHGETDNEVIARKRYLCSVERHDWNLQTVGALVRTADIGLAPMPLTNPFYRAKAFSKPLVYMALGLPVVASGIPSYSELVQNGINGFTVETASEWRTRLIELISSRELRSQIGLAARQRVEQFHSVDAVAKKIKRVFQTATRVARP